MLNSTTPYHQAAANFRENGYHVMHWGKTTNKSAGRRDRTNELPINHFSQAVCAAADKEARKKEIKLKRAKNKAYLSWLCANGPGNSVG